MPFFAPEHLGPNQSKTPEGFLLCKNVPIARTGAQQYLAGEIDPEIKAGPNGIIVVWREPAEVFASEAIASFEGKPVTVLHPDEPVTPDNWNDLTVGHAQNVRRGEGVQQDLLVADLLITSRRAIILIRPDDKTTNDALTEDKRLSQVSCGYDCDYTQGQPGQAWQLNIRGNHIALVPRGRAGPKCAIQDREPKVADRDKKLSLKDRLLALVKDAGDDPDDPDEKKTTQDAEIASVKSDVAELKTAVKDLAAIVKDGLAEFAKKPDDDEGKTKDNTPGVTEPLPVEQAETGKNPLTGDALRLFMSDAQALAPSVKFATTDAAGGVDSLQRRVLLAAATNTAVAAVIAPVLRGRDVAKLTGDALAVTFDGAAALVKAANTAAQVKAPATPGASTTHDNAGPMTPAQLNAANKAFWGKQGGN